MRRTRLAVLALAVGAGPISPQQAPELPLENCGDRASLTVAVLDESGTIPLPGDSIVLPIAIGGVEIYKGPASLPAEFAAPMHAAAPL